MKKVELLAIESIRIDGGTQIRASIDQDTVSDYAEHLDSLPPVDVFSDGAEHWLADGFHRYHAHNQAKKSKIPCQLHTGTVRDAILFACGVNTSHGMRRTSADKRKAVMTLLKDEEWGKRSVRWIPESAGVSKTLVSDIKNEVDCPKRTVAKMAVTGKDGRTTNTVAIAESNTATKSKPAASAPIETFIDNDPEPPPAPKARPKEPTTNLPKDMIGGDIDNPQVAEVFNRRQEIGGLMNEVSRIKSTVNKAINDKDPLFYGINPTRFQADCDSIRRQLKFTLPHAVCSYCGGQGKNCKPCKGSGWLSEDAHDRYVPEDLKV